MAVLDSEFNNARIDIIGVQEGRNSKQQLLQTEHYVVYVAPSAKNGTLGVQLWVAKSLASSANMVVHVISPRIIKAYGYLPILGINRRCRIYVIHASSGDADMT